jgi:hypothetical protein
MDAASARQEPMEVQKCGNEGGKVYQTRTIVIVDEMGSVGVGKERGQTNASHSISRWHR